MMKDTRYSTIKILMESGHIQSIRDIFIFIPKTTVYKDLGVNFNRFDRAILDPSIFRLSELFTLAELFEVDAKKFINLAYDQAITVKHRKRKKRDIHRITVNVSDRNEEQQPVHNTDG